MEFNIFFSGEVARDQSPQAVQARLQQLFRLNDSAAAALFSGRRVQLKKGVDQATMMRFKAALRQAGALCEVEQVGGPATAAVQPAAADVGAIDKVSDSAVGMAGGPAAAVGAGDMDMVGTIRRGGSGFSGAFSVAEVGADLAPWADAATPAAPDTSHLSLAPAGASLEQAAVAEVPPAPDTRHLTLVP